jgi:hypothetical protein
MISREQAKQDKERDQKQNSPATDQALSEHHHHSITQ